MKKWEWHQDFGYWYAQGLLEPAEKCFSCILAIDKLKCSKEATNWVGIFAGDPTKLEPCFDKFELIHCELDKGDVLFTHSNLLHSSAANTSNDWRRSMIVAGKSNQPISERLITKVHVYED